MKIIIIGFFLLQSLLFSSVEGTVVFSEFKLESKGLDISGPITVIGSMNDSNKINKLKIKAFGKEYNVSDSDLSKIPPYSYNGIQLSYERGYEIIGGQTLYLVFQSGFTSGITKKVILILTERGKVKIIK